MRPLLTPKWLLSHLFVAFMVVFMIGLGFWQLDRLDQRKTDNDAIRTASQAAAQPIESLLVDTDVLDHTAVTVTGVYRDDLSFLVANRTFDTQPGSWLVTPVELADGRLVVVSRGWIPRSLVAGDAVSSIDTPVDTVTITGRLFSSVDGGRIGQGSARLPEVSRIDLDTVDELLTREVVPRWVQLTEQNPPRGDLPAPVPPPSLDDGPHLSYAFQWFVFSAGTIGAYVFILRRRMRESPDDA